MPMGSGPQNTFWSRAAQQRSPAAVERGQSQIPNWFHKTRSLQPKPSLWGRAHTFLASPLQISKQVTQLQHRGRCFGCVSDTLATVGDVWKVVWPPTEAIKKDWRPKLNPTAEYWVCPSLSFGATLMSVKKNFAANQVHFWHQVGQLD